MTRKKFILSIVGLYFFGTVSGMWAGYHYAKVKYFKPVVIQFNPDLRNQVQRLNTQVAVLQGQAESVSSRYNNYGARLEVIEDRMKIFNEKVE